MNLDDMHDTLRKRAAAIHRRDELKLQLKTSQKNLERLISEIAAIDVEIVKHEETAHKIKGTP